MKKTTKKLLTFALATLFVAAGIGSVATINVSNASVTANAASLSYTDKAQLEIPRDGALVVVDSKIKEIQTWGYYNVDSENVWYFSGDGSGGNAEIRFSTIESEDPANKVYTAVPVKSFSFDYKIANDSTATVKDAASASYIVQELAADGTYPIMMPTIVADGQWHTLTIDLTTALVDSTGTATGTFDDVKGDI